MNFEEPDHIRQLRDTLRRFVENEMPRSAAQEWDKEDHLTCLVHSKLLMYG